MQANWDAWLEEIQGFGGSNPLRNFEPNAFGQIDLERSHPGGYSQMITGRPTLLSNLVRDPLAYSRALSAARRIKQRAQRLSANFGLNSIYLAGGLADFTADGIDLSVPILLWPIQLLQRGDDYEFEISGAPFVNPELLAALKRHFDLSINSEELLARQLEASDLVPITLLNYLAFATKASASIGLSRVLVISNFVTELADLVADFDRQERGLLSALTGAPSEGLSPIDIPELNLVSDADSTQMRIVARALAGQSFAVETLPGCGYTQTVVNVLAALAEQGKRSLVVAPRVATIEDLVDRLSDVGLPSLAVRGSSAWVDVIGAISRNEKAQPIDLESARAARIAAEATIDNYFEVLNTPDMKLGVSIAEALKQLSALTGMAGAPETSSRIERSALEAGLDKASALELLHEASDLGEYQFGPQDTAWFQAQFDSPDEVHHALKVASRLRDDSFPKLSKQLTEFIQKVNFKPAVSVEDWGQYLRIFMGIRETLDRFVGDVFDRPLTELIAATSPRQGLTRDRQMSGSNRRRLKKLAKEYLRAGVHVADINSSLRAVDEQRELWNRYSLSPVPPQVPAGINDAQVAYQSFVADLDVIQRHLDPMSTEPPLIKLPLADLQTKLSSLAEDTESLTNLGDRVLVLKKIRQSGLGALSRDLAKLHTPKERIASELDLAWWQSALEVIVARDSRILSFVPSVIEANEAQFRTAYEQQIALGAAKVAGSLGEKWHQAIAEFKDEAAALKQELRTGTTSLRRIAELAPHIFVALTPVIAVSPFQVARQLNSSEAFDVVIVLDAAGSTVAENLPALRRAGQLIAFGDDAISEPTGFEIEVHAAKPGQTFEQAPVAATSVYQLARRAFGAEVLRRSYRTTGQALSTLINTEFYQNRIDFTPSTNEYFGNRNFNLEVVTADNRAKTTIEGATESLDAEVSHVVEAVLNHALWRPRHSLMVATASAVHAERISAALKHELQKKPDLVEFFNSHGREQFEVVALSELTHRIADRVIFSIGFGRTQHGAVLSNFGELSQANGRRHLANLLVSARHEITVVSCFAVEDVPSDRLSNGAVLLRELLEAGTRPVQELDLEHDPMLQDLNLRLKKLGVRVDVSFSASTPMVASFGKNAAVIEPDWSIPGASRTERFRLRPRLLQSLGWHYIRVYSFELFSDPQALAQRIAMKLGVQVGRQPQTLFDEKAFEDTDAAWGDSTKSNDQQLKADKPPHWG